MSPEGKYGPGVLRYVEESKKYLAERRALIERVRKRRFDEDTRFLFREAPSNTQPSFADFERALSAL